MKSTKRNMTRAIYTPTLVDSDGHRHIIPRKDAPALCGATGEQEFQSSPDANAGCDVARVRAAVGE